MRVVLVGVKEVTHRSSSSSSSGRQSIIIDTTSSRIADVKPTKLYCCELVRRHAS